MTRADRWSILVLALLVAALFRAILFQGHVLYERDIFLMVYGQAESFVRCVAAGSWPVWDPWVGFGQPMLANPGTQVLYPWTWLNLVFLPETAFTLYAASHLLLGGAGLYALARRLQLAPPAALTSAAVFMLSGPLLSLVSLWQHFAGAAWIPWVLVAADRACESPSLRRALLWGAALAAQILTGSVEMSAASGLLLLPIALRQLRARTRREVVRAAGAATLAFGFAAALTTGLWLPALALLRSSSRAELGEAQRVFWSLHPLNLLQALVPAFPQSLPLRREVQALLYEGREPFLGSVYLGLTTLPLVAASFLGARWRLAGGLATAAALAALFALGKFGIAYPLLTSLIPPLQIFRYPSKAMLLAALAWSLLAGIGYDAWTSSFPRRRWVALAALGAAALVAALAVRAEGWAPAFLLPDPSGPSTAAVLAPGIRRLLVVAGLAALACVLGLVRRGPAGAVAFLAVADLFAVHRTLNPTAPRELIFRRPAALSALRAEGPTRIYVFDYFLNLLGRTYRRRLPPAPPEAPGLSVSLQSTLLTQDFLSPPSAQRWGLYGSYDYDWLALYPRHLRNLTLFFRAAEETPGFRRLLELGGVSYVVARHHEGLEDLLPLTRIESPFAGTVHVFGVPGRLPRSYVVSGSRKADGLEALRTLVDPGFDPGREILLPSGAPQAVVPGFSGEARLVEYRPDRVRVDARLGAPGYLVLLDAHDPGWRAVVDGQPADVLRANVAFRAVALPAGAHVVEMRYRPAAATAGLVMSAIALVLGSALFATRPS